MFESGLLIRSQYYVRERISSDGTCSKSKDFQDVSQDSKGENVDSENTYSHSICIDQASQPQKVLEVLL